MILASQKGGEEKEEQEENNAEAGQKWRRDNTGNTNPNIMKKRA